MTELLLTLYALLTLILLVTRLERGLLFLIPLLPLVTHTYHSPITGLNTANLLVYTAFGMGLIHRMRQSGQPLPPVTIPLFSFFALTLLAWVIGILNYRAQDYDSLRWLINVERWVLFTLLYFAYHFGWSGRIPVRVAFRWMFVGILIAATFNVFEFFFPSAYLQITARQGGVFGQANSNGIFMASYGFLPLALAATARTPFRRTLYLAGFGMCGVAGLLSVSRTFLVCFVITGLVYAYFRSRRAFAGLLCALCLLIPSYAIVLPQSMVERVEGTFSGSRYEGLAGELEGSAANRLVQHVVGLRLFIDSPILGHGLGGFFMRSPRYLPPEASAVARAPHTTFMWVLVDGGIVAMGCFLWLLGGLLSAGKRLYDSNAEDVDRLMGLYLVTIMVTKIVANFFSLEFLTGDVSAYVWVTAGLVTWLNVRAQAFVKEAEPTQQPVRSSWRPREAFTATPRVTRG